MSPEGAQLCYQTHSSDLKIRPIRQVLVEDGLFLKWNAIDKCLISLSLLPIFLLLLLLVLLEQNVIQACHQKNYRTSYISTYIIPPRSTCTQD